MAMVNVYDGSIQRIGRIGEDGTVHDRRAERVGSVGADG
jgi:hypothetical protein